MQQFLNALTQTEITLPPHEVAVMLFILTLCFLLHSYRLGLIASFLFVFRLGWIFFKENFGVNEMGYVAAYGVFGLLITVFACFQLFFGEQ